MARVLVGCEKSQAVCCAFRELGIEAFSCDIQPASGKHPEWHLQEDVFVVLEREHWDLAVLFPPCTHLAVSGAQHFPEKIKDGRQQAAIDFFMRCINAPVERVAVENPIGIMSTIYREPDQIIQPYYFGDPYQKTTCLWLKNLPKLYHNALPSLFGDPITHVGKGEFFEWTDKKTGKKKKQPQWYADVFMKHGTDKDARSNMRSETFPGIARAIAKQFTEALNNQ